MQVSEAALQYQVFRNRTHARRTEAVVELTLFGIPLPHRIKSAFDHEAPEIDRPRRLVDKSLLARRVDHEISGALVVQPLPNLIHEVDGIAHTRGRDVAVRMSRRHHTCEILRIKFLALGNLRTWRRKRGHAAIRCARRRLDAGVGILLVVVADNKAIVIAIEGARDRGESDVRGTAIASFADNIWKFPLPFAFADHRLICGGNPRRETTRAADLRVRPGNVVRGTQVRTVRHIHATGRAYKDGVVARGLTGHSILNRGATAGASAMTGNEWLR